MSIKAAAPTALIVAALALVGDYTNLSGKSSSSSPKECLVEKPTVTDLQGVITGLTRGWRELDTVFSKNITSLASSTLFDDERFLRNIELLKATRQLEDDLRRAQVPLALTEDHEALRRAVAKVRTRLATIDSLYKQFFSRPQAFESELSSSALRDLADHTSHRLRELT
ncbi:hypothetical protein SAMN05216598_5006 [Pseudomonas asplenii]|uniref:Uncharacterized protein n=1 Tax=Pseudomonas asplenii TaxID=53407 RepID=A0A1H1ZDV9_9PSED|nr:hypothetical protein [Pseudomonas asplenii]SDT31737.1 hypothetical protein SAMN05216598_5006 [Pseudomonas asplenii]